MLINDELIHSAWHLCYTAHAGGNYLFEDLDSFRRCSTGTLESVSESTFLFFRDKDPLKDALEEQLSENT